MSELDDAIAKRVKDVESKALAVLTPGVTFRVYKKPSIHYAVCHVRAVVDDEYIVYRVWGAGRWVYKMQTAYYFGLLIADGNLTIIKKVATNA